jgi:hypothetical protein
MLNKSRALTEHWLPIKILETMARCLKYMIRVAK